MKRTLLIIAAVILGISAICYPAVSALYLWPPLMALAVERGVSDGGQFAICTSLFLAGMGQAIGSVLLAFAASGMKYNTSPR